jgi:hypothetical protein
LLKKDSAGECCDACKAVKPAGPDDLTCNGGQPGATGAGLRCAWALGAGMWAGGRLVCCWRLGGARQQEAGCACEGWGGGPPAPGEGWLPAWWGMAPGTTCRPGDWPDSGGCCCYRVDVTSWSWWPGRAARTCSKSPLLLAP